MEADNEEEYLKCQNILSQENDELKITEKIYLNNKNKNFIANGSNINKNN